MRILGRLSATGRTGRVHVPFFEALAENEERTPPFVEATAGLVLLRMFDAWMQHGVEEMPRAQILPNIRKTLEAVDSASPLRAPLPSAFAAITTAEQLDVRVPLPHMLAYAQALETVGRGQLAMEVYDTLLRYVHVDDDRESVTRVMGMLMACRKRVREAP
jgi:hypothetical protein